MKLLIGLVLAGMICGVTAEVKSEAPKYGAEASKEEKSKSVQMSDLPSKVQEAVKKECKGKITSINKVEIDSSVYFKVVTMLDGKQNTYIFDDKGTMRSKSS
tara:strand:+ start:459 stop:764 length:306 start_codon:yes stop_codon:yes gene_type:complete